MRGVSVGSEADFAASETLEGTERGVVSGFPRFINLQRSLSFVDVASPIHTKAAVNFMTTMSAVSTDNAVKSGTYRGHGIFRFAEYPHLDHVTGLSVVRSFGKARGDDHAVLIFMKEESIAHRAPPTRNSATQ